MSATLSDAAVSEQAIAEHAVSDHARTERAPKVVPLRRNVNFQLLWAGSSAAFVGMEVASIAYPLVILAMTHSPFKAGLFATVQLAGMMLCMLPAGQLLDKIDRRRALMAAELVRAVAGAGVAVAWYLGALTFWQLMGTAAVLGAAQPFGAARTLLVRTVVPKEQLTSALTQEQVRDHGAQLVGPPLGGALYAASRALPFVVAAAAMVASLVCAFFVRLPAADGAPAAGAEPAGPGGDADAARTAESRHPVEGGGVLAGLRFLLRDPVMRATTISLAVVQVIGFPLYLALIVLLQQQHQSPGSIGVILGTMSVGGLAGTVLVKPAHRLLRPGWLLIVALTVFALCITALAVAHSPVASAALMFTANLVVPAAIVMVDILILQQVPDAQRGRTMAAFQSLLTLGMPLGMLVSGAALQYFSPVTVLCAMGAWLGVAVLYAVSQRALREARWPDDAPTTGAEAVQTA